jgi:hypothetical protein
MCAPLSAQPVPRNSGLQLGDHLGATQIISAPRRPRAATRRPSARRTAQCLPRPSSAGRQLIECAVQVVGAPVVPPLPPVAQVVRGVGVSSPQHVLLPGPAAEHAAELQRGVKQLSPAATLMLPRVQNLMLQ